MYVSRFYTKIAVLCKKYFFTARKNNTVPIRFNFKTFNFLSVRQKKLYIFQVKQKKESPKTNLICYNTRNVFYSQNEIKNNKNKNER